MSLILNIDTSLSLASVSLAEGGTIIAESSNDNQKDHAAFVQKAVLEVMSASNKKMTDLDAVAVSAGPGSYTGLRVGMASAKGFCYALQKPLIAINTLVIMAKAALERHAGTINDDAILCPMIDARRMEVFTALYNNQLHEIKHPHALVLNEFSFDEWLAEKKLFFFGNGSAKWKNICHHNHANFIDITNLSSSLCILSHQYHLQNTFTDLVFSEPFYVKEFYSGTQ